MIAANKRSNHPLELYSERVATIRWFERNQPERFSLFGAGWDVSAGAGPIRRRFERSKLGRTAHPRFPSWRGRVGEKYDALSQFRFGFCYENARDIPGYVTEKLFDCVLAGTIPIYWGPPNSASLLDPATYVDRSEFVSTAEVVEYVESLDDATLDKMRTAGIRMIEQDAVAYRPETFVNILMNHLTT
jgi:hypothetical protein